MTLKERGIERGLTQSDVAMKCAISLQAYQLIERGVTKNPHPETKKSLMEVLGYEAKSN